MGRRPPDYQQAENLPENQSSASARASHSFLSSRAEAGDFRASIAIGLLLTGLFVFLVVRAASEWRWSDWGLGDAQTMLSVRQWQDGGWLKNYLLFRPQGYAQVTDILDEPELRHHAHGIAPGSGRVGPRLLYTHYPPGYLVPYAVLARVGLTGVFPARILSVIMSVGALLLMYATFATITSPRVSFLSVLFYALSTSCLGFADSLANQPADDLLRFAFMFAVVISTRAVSANRRRSWAIGAWGIQFILSLSSYDSVCFAYVWLIGWDILENRGFRWRRYVLYALAPLLAQSILFCQNAWYLGWHDALTDMWEIFLARGGNAEATRRMSSTVLSIESVFEHAFSPNWLLLMILALYMARLHLAAHRERDMPSGRLLLLLVVSGLAFIVLLPKADMTYQGRQIMPFAALLASGMSWSFIDDIRGHFRAWTVPQEADSLTATPAEGGPPVAYLTACGIGLVAFWCCFAFATRTATFVADNLRNAPDIALAHELKNHATRNEPVYFDLGAFQAFLMPEYVKGYPQINPITEYYAGSRPILCFTDAQSLARDLVSLHARGSAAFSPVVVTRDGQSLVAIISTLQQQGHLKDPHTLPAFTVCGCLVVDLTDHIR